LKYFSEKTKIKMKKKLIRTGVFETNSSSAHSVSIADNTKEFVLDTIYPDQDGNVTLEGGEFGWGWFKHNDALTKANYAAVDSMGNDSFREILTKVLKDQTGAEEIVYLCQESWDKEYYSYIDHDSNGVCPRTYDELKSFIFNKNSYLFGGNDNTTPDPTFYHVPEYKNGRVILPEYKYKLKVEGIEKTTKFLEEPTLENLSDGLNSLVSNFKLYDFGNGLFFADDNYQVDRREDYFEFKSWNEGAIDTEKQEITFFRDAWYAAREIYEQDPANEELDWSSVGYKKCRAIETQLKLEKPELFIRKVNYTLIEIGNDKK
jgi:hypothetical protein